MRIRHTAECFQHSFKNLFCPLAWYCHAYLLSHAFPYPLKDKIIGEGLQACPLAVRERPEFLPVVDVGATAA